MSVVIPPNFPADCMQDIRSLIFRNGLSASLASHNNMLFAALNQCNESNENG